MIDPPHSSLIIETAPEADKGDQHSNIEKVATEHIPIPKDAKATLSTGAGLKIGKVLQPSQAEAQVETDQDFVHIVVDLSVRWQNAMFFEKKELSYFPCELCPTKLLHRTGAHSKIV